MRGADSKSVHRLLELLPDGMLVVTEDGRIAAANELADTLFGYPPQGLLGLRVEGLIPAHSRERHINQRRRFNNNPHRRPMGEGLPLRALRADGTEFPVEVSLSPFEFLGEPATLAAVRDITERIRAQREILRLHEEREKLVGNIAHELNNPLQSAVYAVHLVNGEAERLGPKVQQQLKVLSESLDRIAVLSRQLLKVRPSGDQVSAEK